MKPPLKGKCLCLRFPVPERLQGQFLGALLSWPITGWLCDLGQTTFPLCPQFWRVLEGLWRLCQHLTQTLHTTLPHNLLHHSRP